MRNPKIKKIRPNYRKRVFEVWLQEAGKMKHYNLPFSVFRNIEISKHNPCISIEIEKELGSQGASFQLADGSKKDFPADFVLYYCDYSYNWSPINQLKKTLRNELQASKLSIRVLADALETSPAQVIRLLEENRISKQLMQLFQLAELAGYQIEFNLKKKHAA